MSNISLPSYLIPLPETDTRFQALTSILENLETLNLFRQDTLPTFTQYVLSSTVAEHDVYRPFGGEMSKCGYWWTLAEEIGNCWESFGRDPGSIDTSILFPGLGCVGPTIMRMTLPVDTALIVGTIQVTNETNCHFPNGTARPTEPQEGQLRIFGDLCSIETAGGGTLEEAEATSFCFGSCVRTCHEGSQSTSRRALPLTYPVFSGITCFLISLSW